MKWRSFLLILPTKRISEPINVTIKEQFVHEISVFSQIESMTFTSKKKSLQSTQFHTLRCVLGIPLVFQWINSL